MFERNLLNILNSIFFPIRGFIKVKSKKIKFPYEDKKYLYIESVSKKEREFRKKYHLECWYQSMSRIEYQMLLYHLDLLENVFDKIDFPIENLSVVDVGSKNFYYAPAIREYFIKKGKLVSFDGVEIDAFRRYDDFHSRYDVANEIIKDFPETNYLVMDFLKYKKKRRLITLFLPFIFEEPLLYWGLPIKYYRPKDLMKHAFELLEDNGVWLITNQGKEEQKKQHEILNDLNIPFQNLGSFYSSFYQYKTEHFLTVVKKVI